MLTSPETCDFFMADITGRHIWANRGSRWVFLLGAVFSLGNLYIVYRIQTDEEEGTLKEVSRVSTGTVL
jgi:hypothetical protein